MKPGYNHKHCDETTQRAHDVNTTSPERRCIDVEPTLYKRHVPAGKSKWVNTDQKPAH